MRRIPEEKVYTREQLLKKVRFLKWANPITGKKQKNRAGKEMFLDTDMGSIRVLAYNMERPERLPLFVNIHGGGFMLGSPMMDDPYMMPVALDADVKILSIDYSLSPKAVFPQAVDECYAVVKYAKAHPAEFGIDPDHIAVGGHSAGGNLSAAVCLKDADTRELGIDCAILDYPPLDMYTDPYQKQQPKGSLPPRICRIFDACYCLEKEERKNPLISPVYADEAKLSAFPPTLIITAGRDSLCDEGEVFRNKLIEAGVDVTHKRFADSPHGFTLSNKPDASEAWRMMTVFLKRHLHQQEKA